MSKVFIIFLILAQVNLASPGTKSIMVKLEVSVSAGPLLVFPLTLPVHGAPFPPLAPENSKGRSLESWASCLAWNFRIPTYGILWKI